MGNHPLMDWGVWPLDNDDTQKGDYQVFVYEEDNAEPSGTSEILIPINASENNQIITLDTIYINNF